MEDFLGIEGSKLLAEFLRSPRSQCGTATLQLLLCAACGFHVDVDLGGLTTLQLLRQATFGLQASIAALILQQRRLWSECAQRILIPMSNSPLVQMCPAILSSP